MDELRNARNAVIDRLASLDISGGDSHERLSKICDAVYTSSMGWTISACESLRSKLMWLLDTSEDKRVEYDGDPFEPITTDLRKSAKVRVTDENALVFYIDEFNDLCDAIDCIHSYLEAENATLRAKADEASATTDYVLANLVKPPMYSDGRDVRVGDEVVYDGWPDDVCVIEKIALQANPEHQWCVHMRHPQGAEAMVPTEGSVLKDARLGGEAPTDPVNHPAHYTAGKYEVIDVIEDSLGDDGFEGYLVGNVMKYVMRFRHKNGLEDLKKARWYLDRLIGRCE